VFCPFRSVFAPERLRCIFGVFQPFRKKKPERLGVVVFSVLSGWFLTWKVDYICSFFLELVFSSTFQDEKT